MNKLTLNDQEITFTQGETLLDIATRYDIDIPTLCHDPRLDPAGACRSCLIEIEGERAMHPACAFKARDGLVVNTQNERIDRHRQTLMALYMTDHPHDRETSELGAPDQLLDMAEHYNAPLDWGHMEPLREGREDRNPYVHFNPDTCIACARCTRYCEEIESVSAITLAHRGAHTTIATVDNKSLLDTTCELCGGCIDVCPTGAMTEKLPLTRGQKPERELTKVRSTCNFCGVGCQVDINVDPDGQEGRGQIVKVTSPPPGTTTNDGNLCVKGRFAYDFIHHKDRITEPLVRGEDGELHPTTWEDALQKAAAGLRGVADKYGDDSVGFVSSSRCTMEENFLVQKIARALFRANQVHQCAAT